VTTSNTRRKAARPKGRQPTTSDLAEVRRYLDPGDSRRDRLIEYLHRIQDDLGHLPAKLLVALAAELRLSAVEVYEVASFYHHFDVVRDGQPAPPALTVRVCESVACDLAGAEELIAELQQALGEDVRVQRVPCVGRCEAAPVAVVGTRPVTKANAPEVLAAVASGRHADDIPPQARSYADYRAAGGYRRLIELARNDDPAATESILRELEQAKLRGLGGAGFPAGKKWRIVRGYDAPRLMAVNIDEGEPGTFKDRHYLERDPHRFLDGMLIAAQVVGIDAIYIYLRDEYAGVRALLERELAALQADPPGALPAIELRRGAGAYICGEESAMIESIESIEGERVLAPSCCRAPSAGMKVSSDSSRARRAQELVLELLQSDIVAGRSYTLHSELDHWSAKLQLGKPRYPARGQPEADISHPAIAVNLDACIQCGRCLRACREKQGNDVIGWAGRGADARIVFDLEDPMGDSSCVACGECVQACPTGALMPANGVALRPVDKKVNSVCPYCGVGCQLTYHVADNRILFVEGRDGPANNSRLCVKGRYGFDYVSHRQRLTVPLIRRDDAPKHAQMDMDFDHPLRDFREASWEEALERAANGLVRIRDTHGPSALAGFGSAKGSNEEAYPFQKMVRTGFRTNNVDHCTRLCHASSVAALLQMIGSGAVSNPVADVSEAEVIVLIGANPTENHPVAATFFKNAARAGKTLIVMDPRRTAIARGAKYVLQFKPDTDVAMLNAIMHSVVQQGLVDQDFVARRTSATTRRRPWRASAASPRRLCTKWHGCSPAPKAQ
jgi:NADH:ubiquinone oxidoreductase subunit E/ferredoxin